MSTIAPSFVAASAAIILLRLRLPRQEVFRIPLRGVLLATFLYALALIINWA